MPSKWVEHVKSVYAKGKAKGMSYKQAMIAAKKTYKKGKAAPDQEAESSPKKRRRKKKPEGSCE